jgi:hypothetical protein
LFFRAATHPAARMSIKIISVFVSFAGVASGMQNIDFEESWQIVREELPADLEQRARKTRLVRRMRGFGSMEILTRLLLMHRSGALSRTDCLARARTWARQD